VRTGSAIGDMIEVDGLAAGDKIVLKPSNRVRDGAAVAAAAK
jgi:hypothetical protein